MATLPETKTRPGSPSEEFSFGPNPMRLGAQQWVVALVLFAVVAWLTPFVWARVERCGIAAGGRIPSELSEDYWLYSRRLREVANPGNVLLLGDSVVWGEYVAPDGTLSHFLDQEMGSTNRFVNVALDGLFPLAQEGLVNYYGGALRHCKVLMLFNVLWMSSPEADLSSASERMFNHSRLVPQFIPKISAYKASANQRLSAVIERQVPFLQWATHLQTAYFDHKSVPAWTLEEDNRHPGRFPNACKNPLTQISLLVPGEALDAQRGPNSPRHKPWFDAGVTKARFDWVKPSASIEWAAFQRTVSRLRERDNDVLVILGPFNEHMLDPDCRAGYEEIRDRVVNWLRDNEIPVVAPEILPSEMYADASHPLTAGYELLAKRLLNTEVFQKWLKRKAND